MQPIKTALQLCNRKNALYCATEYKHTFHCPISFSTAEVHPDIYFPWQRFFTDWTSSRHWLIPLQTEFKHCSTIGVLLLKATKVFLFQIGDPLGLGEYHQWGRVTKTPSLPTTIITLANPVSRYVRSGLQQNLATITFTLPQPSASGAPPRRHLQAWLPSPGTYKYHPRSFGSFIYKSVYTCFPYK